MRQYRNLVGRGVSVLLVVVFVAVSASAMPGNGESSWRGKRESPMERLVRFLKRTVTNIGDGISIPRP
ncbi:MAG TPA: hypothetical protein VGF69_22520 [Thermoanaerobaculia bacterium]|jgi:hypothetical protein